MVMGNEFWERWYNAEELDKLRLIEKLPLFKGESVVETTVTSTLLNSYFEDLAKYVRSRWSEKVSQQSGLVCEVCNKNEALGVAAVPGVPMSVAYCKECLEANSHPMYVLVANTACVGGLEHANEAWKQMVMDSLKHQDKTLEWFNEQVQEGIRNMDEYGKGE